MIDVRMLPIADLDVSAQVQGKAVFSASISRPHGEDIHLTILVATGVRPGPVIAVLGAEHGDELEGPLVIARLFQQMDTSQLSGTFVGVPTTNVPAYNACTRTSPEDGLNLARVFPGTPNGSITERIAYWVTEKIIRPADFLISLHSAGSTMSAPLLCGYPYRDDPIGSIASQAAHCFGTEVLWAHSTTNPGRSISAADACGVPWLYTEANGGRRPDQKVLASYSAGVVNVMAFLHMLPGDPPHRSPQVHLTGDGNVDTAPPLKHHGLWVPAVSVLERVQADQLLGCVYDLYGHVIEECRATEPGYVVFLRAEAAVAPGDQSALIAPELIDTI